MNKNDNLAKKVERKCYGIRLKPELVKRLKNSRYPGGQASEPYLRNLYFGISETKKRIVLPYPYFHCQNKNPGEISIQRE